MDLFETMKEPFTLLGDFYLIEFFGGYGSQCKALKNIGANIVGTTLIEVDIDVTITNAAIHYNLNEKMENYDFPSREEMILKLFPYGWWSNDKSKDIARLKEPKLKQLYLAQKLTNNLGNIFNVNVDYLVKLIKEQHKKGVKVILTWSTPCQDFSLAGKGKGWNGAKGSLTSVSLDIFTQLKEHKASPDILLFENVPNIASQTFKDGFNQMKYTIEKLDYENITMKLKATDYGIPQSRKRVFILSIHNKILGDKVYIQPKPFKLEYNLKDMLQNNVEGKYNLSQKTIKTLERHGNKIIKELENPDISSCIHAGYYKMGGRDQQYLIEVDQKYYLSDKQIKQIAVWKAQQKPLEKMESIDKSQISPTLLARGQKDMHSGIILIKEATKKGYKEAYDGDGVYINRPHQKRGVVQKGKIQTIKTQPNDIGVVVYDDYNSTVRKDQDTIGTITGNIGSSTPRNGYKLIETKDNCILETQEKINKLATSLKHYKKEDGNIYISKTQESNIIAVDRRTTGTQITQRIYNIEKESPTINTFTTPKIAIDIDNLRIRKLTELECWRLMGMDDEDYFKAEATGVSSTQLYKQAGNSIVVNVLEAIFKQLKGE